MKTISIGVPCYNEEENIELMYEAITKQMSSLPQYNYEIIFRTILCIRHVYYLLST